MLVESEAIRAIEYDARRRKLRVTFTSGGRYEYEAVSGDLHRAFLAADSKGRFFHDHVLDRYPYRRLR